MYKNKFISFLESLRKTENIALIEAIHRGFSICFESKESDAILDLMNQLGISWEEAKKQYHNIKEQIENVPNAPSNDDIEIGENPIEQEESKDADEETWVENFPEDEQKKITRWPKLGPFNTGIDYQMLGNKTYKETLHVFVTGLKKDPSIAIRLLSDKNEWKQIFNDFPDEVAEGFANKPIAIDRFPRKERIKIVRQFQDAFKKGFARKPPFWVITVFDNHPYKTKEVIELYDTFPSIFWQWYEKYPTARDNENLKQTKYLKDLVRN